MSTGLPAAVKDEEGKTGRNEEQEEELEEDQEEEQEEEASAVLNQGPTADELLAKVKQQAEKEASLRNTREASVSKDGLNSTGSKASSFASGNYVFRITSTKFVLPNLTLKVHGKLNTCALCLSLF